MIAECNVCGKKYEDWFGSTPCCGSLAFVVENGEKTTKASLWSSFNGEGIKPTIIDFEKGETNE